MVVVALELVAVVVVVAVVVSVVIDTVGTDCTEPEVDIVAPLENFTDFRYGKADVGEEVVDQLAAVGLGGIGGR